MKLLLCAGGGALCVVASLAGAQNAAASTDLEEVIISAQRLEDTLPEQLARSGVKVEVVDSRQILDGGYLDVAGSLQALAAGLYVAPKNGPFDYADISLQGSRTADVLWLVDGVRVNNRLYAGTVPLDTLPAAMVNRIEVLDGGQSLFYGTEAIGGAVNVTTRPFAQTPTGSTTLAADSNNARHLDANFADALGAGQFVLYGSADHSAGYQAFRDQDYQPSSTDRKRGYDVNTLGGKYGVDFSERLRLQAFWQHTEADLDYAYPYLVARDVNARREDLATVKLDVQATDRLGFFVKSYYHDWHTNYDTYYNDPANPGTIDVLYDNAFWGYKDRGINVLGKYDFTPGVQAYFGYDLQRYGGRDEVLVIEQNEETTQAVFGQLRLLPALIPNLTLAAGARYNHPDVGEQSTIWNASGQYQLPANLHIKGQMGTNFRLPSAEELFANDPEDERGNPALQPEKSRSANLSFGGSLAFDGPVLHWELTGYARDVDHLIDCDGLNDADQCVFQNVTGTVRTRGGEAQADLTFPDLLTVNANYSHDQTSTTGGVQLDRIPKSLLKAGLDYHPDAPWGATVTLNHTGEVTRAIPGFSTLDYGNYSVVDLSARYFPGTGRKQQFNFSIHNLFDREYGAPARGRADQGGYYVYVNRGLPRTFEASYTYRY